MRAIGLVLSAAIFMFSTTVASSEMPERLKGSWILNAGATENFMRTSPKWGPDAEKYLPRILERMSHYMFEFEDGVITASGQVKRNTMSAMLKEHDAETYVFESTQGDRTITLTVKFVDDAVINIRSSATDDMDFYLWERGRLDRKSTEKEKPAGIELTKDVLNNASGKAAAEDGK